MAALELIQMSGVGQGAHPPLLFVHGGFHGAWCWADNFLPWFAAQGFDCHAVSYRDHGASVRTGRHEEWRLTDYQDDVSWAIDQLTTKPVLVGHSLGGSIIQKIAASGDFPGMILLAPSPIGGSHAAALRMFASHPIMLSKALLTKNTLHALPVFLNFFLSPQAPSVLRESIVTRCNGLTSMKAVNDAIYNDCPKPKPLGFPVLVVSGANDWSVPLKKNVKLAKAYQGNHLVVPTAHDVMCDVSWEAAALQICRWIKDRIPRAKAVT